jgi:ubiquitin-protein ligase
MRADLNRILLSQFKRFSLSAHPNLLAVMDESDTRTWYYLAGGLGAPVSGEYIFKLTAPDTFPARPPRFECLTPNGVYDLGGPVCISIGEFHAKDKPGATGSYGWRPVLGMNGFAQEVVNGLICSRDLTKDGVRILETTAAEKTLLAQASRAYNATHHAGLCAKFDAILRDRAPTAPGQLVEVARRHAQGKEAPAPEIAIPSSRSIRQVTDAAPLEILPLTAGCIGAVSSSTEQAHENCAEPGAPVSEGNILVEDEMSSYIDDLLSRL